MINSQTNIFFMRKNLVKILSALAPGYVTKMAYRQLTNPQTRKLREHELEVLAKSHEELISFHGFQIKTYVWEGGPKRLMLVHGWEGQAGNFADFVEPLGKAGYTVYAFDGPSHGFSSKGKTSLFEFTELVEMLLQKWKIGYLISHSFGGVATTYALTQVADHHIEKYALLTTPDKFSERIDEVAQQVGISEAIKQRLISQLEAETEQEVSRLNVSEFVRHIPVRQALILHDKNDRVIPIEQSKRVADNWKNCSFQTIENTGHFRILRTPSVIDEVLRFLE